MFKKQLANHHMHIFTRKVGTRITAFFLNAAANSRALRKVGTDKRWADRFRTAEGVKDTPGTLVRTGIKIFLRNTVSSVLSFVCSSFQATEGINTKIFCFDSCAFGLSPGEEMIVLFKYYCFHEVEKMSLRYVQVPPSFFFCMWTTTLRSALLWDARCWCALQSTGTDDLQDYMRHLIHSVEMQQFLSVLRKKTPLHPP